MEWSGSCFDLVGDLLTKQIADQIWFAQKWRNLIAKFEKLSRTLAVNVLIPREGFTAAIFDEVLKHRRNQRHRSFSRHAFVGEVNVGRSVSKNMFCWNRSEIWQSWFCVGCRFVSLTNFMDCIVSNNGFTVIWAEQRLRIWSKKREVAFGCRLLIGCRLSNRLCARIQVHLFQYGMWPLNWNWASSFMFN